MTARAPAPDPTADIIGSTPLDRAWTRLLGAPAPGRHVIVVGGGPLAAWLVQGHTRSGRTVVVMAPRICDDLMDLLVERRITWEPRDPRSEDLDDAWVIHAATADGSLSRRLRGWVGARNRRAS